MINLAPVLLRLVPQNNKILDVKTPVVVAPPPNPFVDWDVLVQHLPNLTGNARLKTIAAWRSRSVNSAEYHACNQFCQQLLDPVIGKKMHTGPRKPGGKKCKKEPED